MVPPENLLSLWEKDYAEMSESMIYGDKLSFKDLIEKIRLLNKRINRIKWYNH